MAKQSNSSIATRLNVLTRVRSNLEVLSQSERKIGELLLAEPQQFSQMNVRQVANRTNISEPTVVRFCRNVGYDGFKDLKFQLIQDIAVLQASIDSASEGERTSEVSTSERKDNVDPVKHSFLCAMEALEKANNSIEFSQIASAAKLLCKAKKVAIYGLGGSSSVMALEMHNRLFRLGIPSVPFTDSYQQRMSAATLCDEDVAIFLSSTGRPRALLDSVELAKYYGAKCIGIAPRESALARDMDICLHVELSQSGVYQFQPNPMRFAQLLTIDALAFRVAVDLGDAADDNLKRSRASVASLHGIAPQQPIGD